MICNSPGVSQRTHDGYLLAVRQLADYGKASPDQLSEDQLRQFFLHLKNDRKFAYGSMRVALSGIKFLYTRTCRRDWPTLATLKLQNVKSLPDVLTIEQVHRIVDACTTQRIAALDETSVTFRYTPSKSKRTKTRTVSGKEFVRGFLQHNLPRGFQKVRYYG